MDCVKDDHMTYLFPVRLICRRSKSFNNLQIVKQSSSTLRIFWCVHTRVCITHNQALCLGVNEINISRLPMSASVKKRFTLKVSPEVLVLVELKANESSENKQNQFYSECHFFENLPRTLLVV